jgi:hypothetical protein
MQLLGSRQLSIICPWFLTSIFLHEISLPKTPLVV